MNRLQKIFTGIIWLTLVTLFYKDASAQGWILPLGKAKGSLLEKLSDGTYIILYYREGIGGSTIAKINDSGNILDSIHIPHGINSIKEFNSKIYLSTYSSNPFHQYIQYVDMDLQNLEVLHPFTYGTPTDTLFYHFIKGDPDFTFSGRREDQNCQTFYQMDVNTKLIDSMLCFPPLGSFGSNNVCRLGAAYYLNAATRIYKGIPGNPVEQFDTIVSSGGFLVSSGNKIGFLGDDFYLFDANLNLQNFITGSELLFSDYIYEERNGMTHCADGGFYYTAYRTDHQWFPYVILGKISKFGQLQWKTGYHQYIFKNCVAVCEAHQGDGAVMLVHDEVMATVNNHLYLIKTHPGGMIGTENENSVYQPLQVFPNPATDLITIHFPENNEAIQYRLLSPDGRVVSLGTATGMEQVSLAGLPAGLYHIHSIIHSKIYTTRFIKL